MKSKLQQLQLNEPQQQRLLPLHHPLSVLSEDNNQFRMTQIGTEIACKSHTGQTIKSKQNEIKPKQTSAQTAARIATAITTTTATTTTTTTTATTQQQHNSRAAAATGTRK